MITYIKLFTIVAAACILLVSCKLDEPLIPVPNPNFNSGGTVYGITVIGKKINDDYLSHSWTAVSTVKQYYDDNNVVISGVSVPNRFSTVLLDDNIKNFTYVNSVRRYPDDATFGPYRLYTTDNVLYIELLTNVFFDNAYSTTRITNLTTRAMTWITINTNTEMVDGKPAHEAYQVIFSR